MCELNETSSFSLAALPSFLRESGCRARDLGRIGDPVAIVSGVLLRLYFLHDR